MPRTEIPEYVNEQPGPGQKPDSDTHPRGTNLYRLVGVSFGVLCIVQAALNIFLHLYVYKNTKNVTEERDELKQKLIDVVTYNYTQSGWQYFKGSVYYVSNTSKTWNESREDCLQMGADLMIINSREEQGFTRKLKDYMWIGLTDTETEGTWKWVDGTPLITSYWLNGEPNNFDYGDEDCGEVRWHKEENSWNDEPCNFEKFGICEKKLPLLLSLQP